MMHLLRSQRAQTFSVHNRNSNQKKTKQMAWYCWTIWAKLPQSLSLKVYLWKSRLWLFSNLVNNRLPPRSSRPNLECLVLKQCSKHPKRKSNKIRSWWESSRQFSLRWTWSKLKSTKLSKATISFGEQSNWLLLSKWSKVESQTLVLAWRESWQNKKRTSIIACTKLWIKTLASWLV